MIQPSSQKQEKQKLSKRKNLQVDSDDEAEIGPSLKMRSIHDVMSRNKPGSKNADLENIIKEREKLLAAAHKKTESQATESKDDFNKKEILLAKDVEGITYTKDESGHIKIAVQSLQKDGEVTRVSFRRRSF